MQWLSWRMANGTPDEVAGASAAARRIHYTVNQFTLAILTPVVAVIFQEAGCISVVLSSTLLLWAKPRRPGI